MMITVGLMMATVGTEASEASPHCADDWFSPGGGVGIAANWTD